MLSVYEIPTSSLISDSMGYTSMGETLSGYEQMYEDPGHKTEKIYATFEKRKFQKIKRNDIQCVGINTS